MSLLYPKQLLHIEGVTLLVAAVVLYARMDASWWLFALLFFAPDLAIQLAVIWIAHIGFDRMLGYGLKYPDGFKETHFGRV